MARGTPVADEDHCIAIREQPRAGPAGELLQQSASVKPHGGDVAGEKLVKLAGGKLGGAGDRGGRKAESPQLNGWRKPERAVDRGARRRRIEPGGKAKLARRVEAGVDQ